MITPIELQSKNFKSGIGYDKKDVDGFLSELLRNYETMYKENMELNDKINTLNEGINYYKSIEKTLQKALILAEQAAEDTKEAARKQAKAIEDEANGKASLIISESYKEVVRLRQQKLKMIQQYESFKAQFKHLASAQVEILEGEGFRLHIDDDQLEEEASSKTRAQTDTQKTAADSVNLTNVDNSKTSEAIENDGAFEFYHLSEE